jgi:pimeloyl-ACP methyl ester carboxylesterase
VVTATHESQGCNLGLFQCLKPVKTIYGWYGKPENVQAWFREGEHGNDAGVIETYLDWLDRVFGRGKFVLPVYAGFTYLNDLQNVPKEEVPDKNSSRSFGLGVAPPMVKNTRFPSIWKAQTSDHFQAKFMTEAVYKKSEVREIILGPYREIGDYLWGNVYYPKKDSATQKYPLEVYLHGFSYNTGYRKEADGMIRSLTSKGFAVLCFDQIGFGTRQEEAARFYQRFPAWSLLGKMAHDAETALETALHLENIDSSQIHILGNGLGALVALQAFEASKKPKSLLLFDPLLQFLGEDENTQFGYWLHKESGLIRSASLQRQNLGDLSSRSLCPVRWIQPTWPGINKADHPLAKDIQWIPDPAFYSETTIEAISNYFKNKP